MAKKLIIFNSPPQSGKDTIASTLTQMLGIKTGPLKFAKPLKDAAHALLGLKCSYDAYEGVKEIPNQQFNGMSPRDFYIWLSEVAVKPNQALGKYFFGHTSRRTIAENPNHLGVYVFSDGGFIEELEVLTKDFPVEDILLIRINREGSNYSKDSRGPVEFPGIQILEIDNNGSLDDVPQLIIDHIYPWLGESITNHAVIKSL
jgi:hypothetical protein